VSGGEGRGYRILVASGWRENNRNSKEEYKDSKNEQ
jgi:hypothetical protein